MIRAPDDVGVALILSANHHHYGKQQIAFGQEFLELFPLRFLAFAFELGIALDPRPFARRPGQILLNYSSITIST